jgi:hypothetical protein
MNEYFGGERTILLFGRVVLWGYAFIKLFRVYIQNG